MTRVRHSSSLAAESTPRSLESVYAPEAINTPYMNNRANELMIMIIIIIVILIMVITVGQRVLIMEEIASIENMHNDRNENSKLGTLRQECKRQWSKPSSSSSSSS